MILPRGREAVGAGPGAPGAGEESGGGGAEGGNCSLPPEPECSPLPHHRPIANPAKAVLCQPHQITRVNNEAGKAIPA